MLLDEGAQHEPGPLVDELRARLREELDYRLEARNQQFFADHYRGHPFLHIPEVVPSHSGATVITSELVTGSTWREVLEWPQDEKDLAGEALFRFVFRSLYGMRAFNGDPHPGNYLFHGDGRVTFLDFGLVGELRSAGVAESAGDHARREGLAIGDKSAMTEALHVREPAAAEPEEERSAETGRYHDDEPTAHDRMYNSDDWVRAQRDAEGLDEAKKKSRKEVLADADEKYPNLKPESMKKGLSHMKGKDFKEKAKKNFGWADKPEAAAAAYMRKATGKEPRDI